MFFLESRIIRNLKERTILIDTTNYLHEIANNKTYDFIVIGILQYLKGVTNNILPFF